MCSWSHVIVFVIAFYCSYSVLCNPAVKDRTMSYVSFVVSEERQAELFTLYLGDRLDLSCSAKDSLHAVNWTKDHVAVVDGEHTRIRDGQLEIETVELTDSGLYTCTTFSNHSDYFNVTGKVIERSEQVFSLV